MFGAGIVLLLVALVLFLAGRSLDGSGSDVFALAGLMPQLAGAVLALVGLLFAVVGW